MNNEVLDLDVKNESSKGHRVLAKSIIKKVKKIIYFDIY